jgi:cell division ATPase FtsA
VLTGGSAQIARIDELAKSALSLPSRIGRIELSSTAHGQAYDPSWTVAYGLSILGLSPDVTTGTTIATFGGGGKMFKNAKGALGSLFKKLLP